jgi:hypothetical protein
MFVLVATNTNYICNELHKEVIVKAECLEVKIVTTKTVKQIVDEYLAKQNEQKKILEYAIITKVNGANSVETVKYLNVTDINEYPFYDLEYYGMKMSRMSFTCDDCTGKNSVFLIGKIIETSRELKE